MRVKNLEEFANLNFSNGNSKRFSNHRIFPSLALDKATPEKYKTKMHARPCLCQAERTDIVATNTAHHVGGLSPLHSRICNGVAILSGIRAGAMANEAAHSLTR